MLLYTVAKCKNIAEISLRFFESFHGQSKGDSAHSAISYAMKRAGDIFIPAQLSPVFQLSRRQQPYHVYCLRHDDFLDFKELSKSLRILSVKAANTGEKIKWTEMMEFRVQKQNLNQILFKTSHQQGDYKVLLLKWQKNYITKATPASANSEPD